MDIGLPVCYLPVWRKLLKNIVPTSQTTFSQVVAIASPRHFFWSKVAYFVKDKWIYQQDLHPGIVRIVARPKEYNATHKAPISPKFGPEELTQWLGGQY